MTSQIGHTANQAHVLLKISNIKVVQVKPVLCKEVEAVKNISISIKHHQIDEWVD
jgi:hypothetical protein